MRYLVTVNGSKSHVRKFLPLVRALAHGGDEVLVVTSDPLAPALAREPVTVLTPLTDAYAGLADILRAMAAAEEAGMSFDSDDVDETDGLNFIFASPPWRSVFGEVLAIAREFKPDLLLRDDFECVGYLVAERLGIPHVAVTGGTTLLCDPDRIADPLAVHGPELGMDSSGHGLYGYGRIDYLPSELSFTAKTWPTVYRYRQPVLTRPGEALPRWVADLAADGRPLVYAGLGTSLPMQAELHRDGVPLPSSINPEGEVQLFLDALSQLDCHAVVVTGGIGGSTLKHGADVHVTDFLPQPLMLEVADLFLSHGGYNGIREAVRAAVPMVVQPQGGDQPHNAKRVADLGLGLAAEGRDADALAAACGEVLGTASFRARARTAKRQVLTLPEVDEARDQLERVIRGETDGI